MDKRPDFEDTYKIERALEALFHAPQPDQTFIANLERTLTARGPAVEKHPTGIKKLWEQLSINLAAATRTAAAASLTAGAALLLVLALGWIFTHLIPRPQPAGEPSATPAVTTPLPQVIPPTPGGTATPAPLPTPTPASLPSAIQSQAFGYLPLAGFIDLETARVLAGPVAQHHAGQEVVVSQAVGLSDQTRLWLHFDGDRQSLEGAWLELPDETRLPAVLWDSPGGDLDDYLQFANLPEGISEATLGLPQGWRLPLKFVSPAEAGIPSAGLNPPVCQENTQARLCILAAAAGDQGTHVLISGESLLAGAGLALPLAHLNPVDPSQQPVLLHNQDEWAGWVMSGAAAPLQPGDKGTATAGQPVLEMLDFEPLPDGTAEVTLHLPDAVLQFQLETSLEIDLGQDPQPGTTWTVDLPVEIGGRTIIFNQATLTGDGNGSLRLELTSRPVENENGGIVSRLEIGRPTDLDDLYGMGFDWNTRQHQLSFELIDQEGQTKHGILEIPLLSAQVTAPEGFDLAFQVNAQAPAPAPTPVVVDESAFVPPPTATPLPLASYEYSGRPPLTGEALFAVHEVGATGLYAGDAEKKYALRKIATLPGTVYSLSIHPGMGGLDYITGRSRNESEAVEEAQLYTLSLDGSPPQRLLGPLPALSHILWSPDGRYLFYSTSDDSTPYLLNLAACRKDPAGCASHILQLSWQQKDVNLNCPAWSPTDHQMAFCGVDESLGTGFGDVYLADLDVEGLRDVVSLTDSPEIAENFGAAWQPDGEALFFIGERAGETNIFRIFRHALGETESSDTGFSFPSVPNILAVSPDNRYLALARSVKNNPRLELADLQTGELNLVAEGEWIYSAAFSLDGSRLLYQNSQGQAWVANLLGGKILTLGTPGQAGVWAGWAP